MTRPAPALIVIKGAPGIGKSTAAKLLAAQLPSSVRIEVDLLRSMVTAVEWTNQSEHQIVLKLASRLASGFLEAGYAPVIVVDTFSGNKIDGFLEHFRAASPQVGVCVHALHASADVLRRRMLDRESGGFRDWEVARRLNDEVVRHRRPFESLLDATDLTPTETADAMLGHLTRPAGEPQHAE